MYGKWYTAGQTAFYLRQDVRQCYGRTTARCAMAYEMAKILEHCGEDNQFYLAIMIGRGGCYKCKKLITRNIENATFSVPAS